MSKRWAVGGIWAILISGNLLMFGWNAAAQQAREPGKTLISEVIISGNQRMSKEQILAMLRTKVGSEFNPGIVDEAVRDMYKTNQFSNISTSYQSDGIDKVKIFFSLREMPNMVQKVTFLGAKHLKPDELQILTGVRVGMPLNAKLNQLGCRKILAKYEEMGRSLCECRLLKGGDLADTEVVYQITEGPKVKVRDIQFTGKVFVSGARLATQIKSSRNPCLLIGGTYDKSLVEADIGDLYKYYRSFGFQDVRISSEIQHSSDDREVTIIYHIQEGPRYRVREAPEVSGNPGLPGEQLTPLSQIKPGDYLDEEQVKADVKKITGYIMRHNGCDALVVPIPVWFFESPGECNIRYEVILEGKVKRPPCDRIAPCAAEPRSLPEHGVLSWPKPQRPSKDSSKKSKSKDTSSIR